MWIDKKGNSHDTKSAAKISNYFITISAGFKYGFPVLLPTFWANGVAMYPFIFLNKKRANEETYFHEMVHIQQQKEMLVIFAYLWYGIELGLRTLKLRSLNKAYNAHSMEREARHGAKEKDYLIHRKPFQFLKFLKMLTVSNTTTSDEITAIHALPEGTIVKIAGDYERNVGRLYSSAPSTVKYHEIRPGVSLFALYGCNHVILQRLPVEEE